MLYLSIGSITAEPLPREHLLALLTGVGVTAIHVLLQVILVLQHLVAYFTRERCS